MKWLQALLIAVGVFHLLFWVLGSLGALDYYVCIKPVGECITVERTQP